MDHIPTCTEINILAHEVGTLPGRGPASGCSSTVTARSGARPVTLNTPHPGIAEYIMVVTYKSQSIGCHSPGAEQYLPAELLVESAGRPGPFLLPIVILLDVLMLGPIFASMPASGRQTTSYPPNATCPITLVYRAVLNLIRCSLTGEFLTLFRHRTA